MGRAPPPDRDSMGPLAAIGLPAGLQFPQVLLHQFQQSRIVRERIVGFCRRIRRVTAWGILIDVLAHCISPMTRRRRAIARIQSFPRYRPSPIRSPTSANDSPCK